MEKALFDKLYTDVFTEQQEKELTDTINLVEAIKPKIVVEIGMKVGGTLNFWRHLTPKPELVIGIDSDNLITWDTSSDPSVRTIIGNSLFYGTYEKLRSVLDGRDIDFLFIDGGHVYGETKSDFYTYGWHVRKGGLIAIHDTYLDSCGDIVGAVKHFWEETKRRSGRDWKIVYDEHINTGTGVVEII